VALNRGKENKKKGGCGCKIEIASIQLATSGGRLRRGFIYSTILIFISGL